MKELPAALWVVTGWLSLLLVAISFIFATIDGVMAMLLVSFAMVVGGASGLGVNATAQYGLLTVLSGTALVFGTTHYVVSTGFEVPTLTSFTHAFDLVAGPLILSVGMLIWGVHVRRRNTPR